MDTFALFFRMDIQAPPTTEQLQVYMQQWQRWMDTISAEGRLEGGNHLSVEGCVLKPQNETQPGPYITNRESLAGYILIKADNLHEAADFAKECPILQGEGTSVEVRKIETT